MSNLFLGTYSCEYNRVDKTNYISFESQPHVVDIFENGTDEDTYTIILDMTMEDVRPYNYCKIDGKEYFLEPVRAIDGGMCEIKATADVLHQNRTRIFNSEQVVEKNETFYQTYFKDPNFTYAAYELIDCYKFPNSMVDDTIILMTVG